MLVILSHVFEWSVSGPLDYDSPSQQPLCYNGAIVIIIACSLKSLS